MMTKRRLENKTIFITGTGGGQGRAAAVLFAKEGARIVGCDVKKDGGEETVAMIKAEGGESLFRVVDLGNGNEVKDWFDWGIKEYGQMDVLYNNASACKFAPLEDMSWDEWHFTIRNELDLLYWACHYGFPHMKKNGGSIINTASGSGLMGYDNLGNFAHSATKGGVISLTRQVAAEGAKHNIRCNSISPGFIVTPVTAALMDKPEYREFFQDILNKQMLKRPGKPEDIAYCALYLASDEAAWVTGSNFVIDGGKYAA